MNKDSLSATRILRLNRLVQQLQACGKNGTPVGSDALVRDAGYHAQCTNHETAVRLLQRDIQFLRDSFFTEITYDRVRKGYTLESLGSYVLFSFLGVPAPSIAA